MIGKAQEWEGFAIAKSLCNQIMAYFNILFNFLNYKIITINITSNSHNCVNFISKGVRNCHVTPRNSQKQRFINSSKWSLKLKPFLDLLNFIIREGKKTSYLDSDVIIKCPKPPP